MVNPIKDRIPTVSSQRPHRRRVGRVPLQRPREVPLQRGASLGPKIDLGVEEGHPVVGADGRRPSADDVGAVGDVTCLEGGDRFFPDQTKPVAEPKPVVKDAKNFLESPLGHR